MSQFVYGCMILPVTFLQEEWSCRCKSMWSTTVVRQSYVFFRKGQMKTVLTNIAMAEHAKSSMSNSRIRPW